MVFAAAQFLFKVDAAGDFRTQSAIDPDDHRQHGDQQQQPRQAVNDQIGPKGSMIEDVTDPMFLDGADFCRCHVRQDFVQDADQNLLVLRHAHGQLIAIGRLAADIEAIELELAQAPDAGSEIADHRVHFIGRQCLQGRTDVGHAHKVQVGVVSAQQFMRRVVFHHGDFQTVQLFKLVRLSASDVGKDDDRKVEVGARKRQVFLTLRGRHDAWQQIQFRLFGLLKHSRPAHRLDGRELDGQALANQVDVIRRKALIAALIVTKLKGWP
ncbi:hypothetical protein D3C84_728460 [compost metagenome]